MGKQLIIAEKPSVGREIAKALGCASKSDGYLEGDNYVISWTIGHLMEAAPPEAYNPDLKSWSLNTLPILPEKFKFIPIEKTAKQLAVIEKLTSRKDIESVVIATDAGREGEVIARLVLMHAGCKKPLFRFWTSQALSPEIIKFGVTKGLKPASQYDRIFQAGYQRTMADWLVGMNLTRSSTVRMGNSGVFSVGRVQTAVLALLVDRKIHRENFKSEPYWVFKIHFANPKGKWTGSWFKGDSGERETRFRSKEQAREIATKINGATGKVATVEKKKCKTPPPQLYSLTQLQRDANRFFGFTAQQTLDLAQALYEQHQAISYPRTDSQVLGSQSVKMASDLVTRLSSHYNDLFKGVQKSLITGENKRVFNDAKLTDHHALIPLRPAKDSFSESEKKIYEMVLTRFATVFHPDYEYEATEIITEVKGETFMTRGQIALKIGWKVLYQGASEPEDDQRLPALVKNDPANIEKLEGEEKQTQPLSEYTEASLLDDMSNPAKYVEQDDLKAIYRGEVGLGTQATRAQIIETLLKREYLVRNKKQLLATDKGCGLIGFLRKLPVSQALASPTETAKWEQTLNQIALGEAAEKEFETKIRQFIVSAIAEFKSGEASSAASAIAAQSSKYGTCPACGGAIIKGKKGYGCSNWRANGCNFIIWETIAGKTLSEKDVTDLLAGKQTREMKLKSKQDSEFTASLKLVQNGDSWKTEFVFADRGNGQGNGKKTSSSSFKTPPPGFGQTVGKCPECGSPVLESMEAFTCSKKECKFAVWKTIAKRAIDQQLVRELLENGRTKNVLQGFQNKVGKPFEARLSIGLDQQNQRKTVQFEFR